jgi:hypothetical protein
MNPHGRSQKLNRLLLASLLGLTISSCMVGNGVLTLPTSSGALKVTNAAPMRFESEQRWGDRTVNRWEPVVAAEPNSSWNGFSPGVVLRSRTIAEEPGATRFA